jgi:hypothetical protein
LITLSVNPVNYVSRSAEDATRILPGLYRYLLQPANITAQFQFFHLSKDRSEGTTRPCSLALTRTKMQLTPGLNGTGLLPFTQVPNVGVDRH